MSCLTPFSVRDKKTKESIPVPCGKCPKCLSRRVSGWSFRLMQHYKETISAYFVTLTYDGDNLHFTKNGFMDLNKRDLQLFFKRLRRSHEVYYEIKGIRDAPLIKYYAVGEYGGKSKRPHYHVILFNAKYELIEKAWQLGNIHVGTVTEASVGYTLKYINKPSRIPMHRNDDRQKEFPLMSKGLGANYLTPQMVKWHLQDMEKRMYVNIGDGKKAAMPRYYKDKIYNEQQRKRVAYFAKKDMLKRQLEAIQKNPDNYWRDKAESAIMQFRKLKLKNDERGTI